jgi:DinB superfamily
MHGQSIAFPDYGFYSTAELITAFAAGATRYRQAIDDLTDGELRARARGPGRWSIHEIILHSADSEMQGTFRIRKTWCEPPAVWPVHDQDVWSRVLDYQGQGTEARERALTLIATLREQTLPLFRRATGEDWRKSGTHPEFGVLTLRNLLELYADHSERHVGQILDSRQRLNRPLEMKQLLAKRLF